MAGGGDSNKLSLTRKGAFNFISNLSWDIAGLEIRAIKGKGTDVSLL
jgi:hypothetical protein